jgi:hypothetical protein
MSTCMATCSSSRFLYTVFGLTMASALECPGLLGGEGAPDVTIRYGQVPTTLGNVRDRGVAYEMNQNQFLLYPWHIARYLVSAGAEIVIERGQNSRDEDLRVFLLGSVFGALLHQRGILPLHGSAIEANHRAVMFTGPSGCGKSTLAAAFQKHGYRVVADDICAVSCDGDGTPRVFPAYPQLSLWADAAEYLQQDVATLRRVRMNLEKYAVPLRNAFSTQPLPLSAVYELATTNTTSFTLTPLYGKEKLALLMHNTYRKQWLQGMGKTATNFQQCAAAGQYMNASRVVRPQYPFLLDELVNLIKKDLA